MAETDRVYGLIGTLGIKAPCRAATTAPITLSGTQTVDGVALVAGDRVLVKDQASSADNGIYDVQVGAWTRSPDFDGARDVVKGTTVNVNEGTVNAVTQWRVTSSNPNTPGVTSITFSVSATAFGDIATAIHASPLDADPGVLDELGIWDSVTGLLRKITFTFLQFGVGAVLRSIRDKLGDTLCVKDFGVVGDGITDDAAALNLAFANAIANKKALKFERKSYRVSAAVLSATMGIGEGLVIRGNGATIVCDMADLAVAYDGFFTVSGTSANDVTIRDLAITSTLSGAQSTARTVGKAVGLALKTLANLHLENVKVSGFPFINIWPYKIDAGSIINCSAINASYAGLLMQSCTDFLVQGGTYKNNGGLNGVTIEGYGITCATKYTGADRDTARVKISGVSVLDNIGKGIDAHDCNGFTVIGNTITGFTFCGIYAVNEGGSKNVSDVIIKGNKIDGTSAFTVASACYAIQAGGYGTTCTYSGSLIIAKNSIKTISASSTTNSGILIENGAAGGIPPVSVLITDNTLNDAAKTGNPFAIKTNNTALLIGSIIVKGNIIHQTIAMTSGILVGACTNAIISENIINTSSTCTQGLYPYAAANTVFDSNVLTGTFTTPITVFGSLQISRGNLVNGVPALDYMYAGSSIEYGTVAPASGYHYQGSMCINSAATVGQPKGWRCTVAGTPGTWVSEGNL